MQLAEGIVQPYRGADKAVVDLIHQGLKYPPNKDAQPLMCVFAVPERAFAQIWKRLGQPEDSQKVIPLPFASIDRTDVVHDPNRERPAVLKRMGSLWDKDKGEEIFYEMAWPIPVNVTYQVTFWARLLRDLDDLVLQLRMLFDVPGQGKYLSVEFPFPMDTRIVWTHINEVRRLPLVETSEKQRSLRSVVELEMSGWLAKPSRFYKRVENIEIELRDSPDLVALGTLLETVTVP